MWVRRGGNLLGVGKGKGRHRIVGLVQYGDVMRSYGVWTYCVVRAIPAGNDYEWMFWPAQDFESPC